jgi:hypothetical protein
MCLIVLALAVLMSGQSPPQIYLIVPTTLSDVAGDGNGLSDNIAVAVLLKFHWHGIDTPKASFRFPRFWRCRSFSVNARGWSDCFPVSVF